MTADLLLIIWLSFHLWDETDGNKHGDNNSRNSSLLAVFDHEKE